MEFPETGEQCSVNDCKQLDFLPFICDHCGIVFCKNHINVTSHSCSKSVDNIKVSKDITLNHICSQNECKEKSVVEMPCVKCKKHFCLLHRYHNCLELNEEEKTKKLKKWQIPKKQFAEAKAIVDQQVSDSLRKSKNTAMANKVQLMKVKGSAVGPKNVPTDERCYFLVYPPRTIPSKVTNVEKGIYVNKMWSIGKAIDIMADILKVPNNNNLPTTNKLNLFHQHTGTSICNKMDTCLTELFENSSLIDGQRVILEYCNDVSVDPALYK